MIARHLDDIASGELKAVIDRTFPLSEAAAAHAYIESRQAFGRVLLIPDGKGQLETSVLTDRIHDRQSQLEVANVRSWSRPLGWSRAAQEAVGKPLDEITAGMQRALHYYSSATGELKGHVTRMELTMYQNPLSYQGIASLTRIEVPGKMRYFMVTPLEAAWPPHARNT